MHTVDSHLLGRHNPHFIDEQTESERANNSDVPISQLGSSPVCAMLTYFWKTLLPWPLAFPRVMLGDSQGWLWLPYTWVTPEVQAPWLLAVSAKWWIPKLHVPATVCEPLSGPSRITEWDA
jgi:hypothetical protein